MGDERGWYRRDDRADRIHRRPGRRTHTPEDGDARDGAVVEADTDAHIAVEGSRLLDLPRVTDEIVSLPIHPWLHDEEAATVTIRSFE